MDFPAESARQMVESQIQLRGIRNPGVLAAMAKVRRDLFVPEAERPVSFADRPLPIGYEQTISQPYVVAYMSEQLEIDATQAVLEIGTGSGYQTSILAELAGSVFTIERIPQLANGARSLLTERLHYSNIDFRIGDGRLGWPEKQPFDRIVLTAAAAEIPQALLKQLADPGILVAPVGRDRQFIEKIRLEAGVWSRELLLPVIFVPLL